MAAIPVPTILATEATALDSSKKRKLQDAIDLGAENGAATHVPIVMEHNTITEQPTDADNTEVQHSQGGLENTQLNQQANNSTIPAAPKGTDQGENTEHDHAENHSAADGDEDGEDDDDDDDEIDELMMEQIMDGVEADPFIPDSAAGITREAIDKVHARLREIGIDQFFEETLTDDPASARKLGPIFGLDPDLEVDDDLYLRVVGAAIVRAYHKRQKLHQYNTIDDAAALLQKSNKIMVITGAGVSTSLGIPDFRSKGTGFYDKVRQLGYDEPEDVFDIGYFEEKPEIFYSLAGDILPDLQRFSPTHAFIRLLQDKGRLQTNYTQNIDNLEEAAGIDEQRIVQCHGSFATATCRKCGYKVKGAEIYPDIRAKRVPRCTRCVAQLAEAARQADPRPPKRPKTQSNWDGEDDDDDDDTIPEPGIMKPDITFFGEQLPDTFFDRLTKVDAEHTDLVIVIGTSLKVAPVSEMPNYIPHTVPHIYISLEPIRHVNFDIQLLGNCDDVVVELCNRAGWELKHEMIPPDFRAKVLPVPGHDHMSAVVSVGGLGPAPSSGRETGSTSHSTAPEPLKAPLPSEPTLADPAAASVEDNSNFGQASP